MKISTRLANKGDLKKIKIKAVAVLFWLLLWALAAQWVNSPLVLPSPFLTLMGVFELASQEEFFISLATTLLRVFGGVLFSVLLGLILGVIGGLNRIFYELMSPFVSTIKSLPVVSVIILINLWINSSIVPLMVTFLICFPVTWTNVVQGIRETDQRLLQMAKVYNVPEKNVIFDVYIPSIKPYFISALMNAIGLGWKVTVTAEVLANALPSVGMNLYYAKIYLETDSLFSWTLIIVLCSIVIEKVTLYYLNRIKKKGEIHGHCDQ